MTNYEWLVKNNKLAEFIFDVAIDYNQSRQIGPVIIDANSPIITERINLKEKYGIIFEAGQKKSQKIADWLVEKHPSNRRNGRKGNKK